MAQRHKYLAKARAVLDGQAANGRTVPEELGDGNTPQADAQEPWASSSQYDVVAPHERNENNEQSRQDDVSATALAMARVRAGLSKRLQHWEDERLHALVLWNLVIAFDRGSATGFRRHLVPALTALTDSDLAALIDWPTLATLEQRLWETDPAAAEPVSRGAQKLAAWWNARQSPPSATEAQARPPTRTPQGDGRRLDGL
jgi:hypothetical protein